MRAQIGRWSDASRAPASLKTPVSRTCRFVDRAIRSSRSRGRGAGQDGPGATTLNPAMPILLVTGYAGAAGARPDFLGDDIKLLRKPFTLKQLVSSVRSLL